MENWTKPNNAFVAIANIVVTLINYCKHAHHFEQF